MLFFPTEIIKKKRNKQELSASEISFFINSYTKGDLPDYQMSALLMAIYLNGMSHDETLALTEIMLKSGVVLDFSHLPQFKVDKHSTGGVGDKTSLILGPIVASCGIAVPMISGRGLGHTGGTLDKLESIPGFNTQLSLGEFREALASDLIGFIGQTTAICPADKKIYSLRDVTSTVESLPLICASIMSKKLAEGIDGLVLDVKFGSGAFMKTTQEAETLALGLMGIARGYKKKVVSLLTSMNQPLGRFAGNSLEVFECLEIMENKSFVGPDGYDLYNDTRELSLLLSSHMIYMSGKTKTLQEAQAMAEAALQSGAALKKFKDLCRIHSADLSSLPKAKKSKLITSDEDGFIFSMDTEKIGLSGIALKAGRQRMTDLLDPVSGIEFHKKLGDPIKKGEVLYTLHGNDENLFSEAEMILKRATTISLQKRDKDSLIFKTLT